MYGYEWTGQNGIYRLSVNSKIEKEIRPVFKEELDYFGFNEHWTYPDTDAPLLWAEGIRRYILNGTCVAEATGGGFYTKPTIKIYTEGMNLDPIDVDALWKENERLMLGLEKTSMDFIRKTHDKYEKQGMAFAVAFSGGKDSLVLLDLVSRTLSPDEFSVVFSNTGMELSTTIQSVEKAKKHWPSLKFYEAKSHLKPTDSWEEFGPPGRRMRWCCAVHKSVPTILLLRELTGNYSYACKKASCASEIPEKIRDEILLISNRSDRWIEERMAAVRALSFHSFDDSYFALMDKLPLDETKLKLLTYQTHEEKTYAVKVISNMLRSGAEPSAIATTLLERDYPSLASYMKDEIGCDDVIDEYMAWYRKNKIINRYPGDYPVQMTFDRFDARYKLMHKLQGQDCVTFWIDGFGSEYTPLFLYELKVRGIVPESVKLATALLPTETEYNHQWDEHDPMTIKWDRLDSFSHKGMPDDKSYYSCIVHQLSVFSDAAKKVEELLENHEYVVVTGDHGSSRFAALAFHQENVVPISAPKKSTVRSFGRFCELNDNAGDVIALPNTVVATSNGKRYLVMDNYQHFSVSGNAAGGNTDEHDVVGEIHGGNTAEERLVSVIVIKRKQPLPPVTCKPKGGLFVTKKNGHVEKALQFSRPISTLEVSYYNKEATCTMNADGSWLVILDGVTTDDITLSVIANGRLLPNVTLKVKAQGISKNDDPFGGMGL